jgi:hypothetical protein
MLGRTRWQLAPPRAKAAAWLVRNVEEVGNLAHFLPDLCAACAGDLE